MSCDDCSFPYSLCQCEGVKIPPPKDEPMRLLTQMPPLTGTLDKSEVEMAAALILFAHHVSGREWSASVPAKELGKVVEEHGDKPPLKWWITNPFLRPDFAELVERGWAVKQETPDGDVLTLTPAALERVAKHLIEASEVTP
jgi:hypothetical protein